MWLLLPPLLIGLRVVSRPEVFYMVGLAMQAWSLILPESPQSQASLKAEMGLRWMNFVRWMAFSRLFDLCWAALTCFCLVDVVLRCWQI